MNEASNQMTIISGKWLEEISFNSKTKIVEEISDQDKQIGHNGIDLTLRNIYSFVDRGIIGKNSDDRSLSKTQPIKPDENGWFELPSDAYKIDYNEIISVPKNMVGISMPRSSLLRNGVTICTAIWDSGYRGRGESLLMVENRSGFRVQKDSRIVQILFTLCSEEAVKGYSGRYQNVT